MLQCVQHGEHSVQRLPNQFIPDIGRTTLIIIILVPLPPATRPSSAPCHPPVLILHTPLLMKVAFFHEIIILCIVIIFGLLWLGLRLWCRPGGVTAAGVSAATPARAIRGAATASATAEPVPSSPSTSAGAPLILKSIIPGLAAAKLTFLGAHAVIRSTHTVAITPTTTKAATASEGRHCGANQYRV